MRGQNIIDLADIISMRFECRECHGAITIPLGKGATQHVTHSGVSNACRFCTTPSGFKIGTEQQKALEGFVENLERLHLTINDSNLKLKLGFEIARTDQ